MRVAIFDCDGTLVDSQAAICQTMERAFELNGLAPPQRSQIRRIVGLSLSQAAALLAPEQTAQTHEALAAAYREAYAALRAEGQLSEQLYPGIAELILRLHQADWLLAVATGKSMRGLTHLLESNGLSQYFVSLQTADFHPSKPDPSMVIAVLAETGAQPHEAAVIGDTSYDMAMAAAADVAAIGVDWGYHDPAELRSSGAAAVVGDCDALWNALEEAVP